MPSIGKDLAKIRSHLGYSIQDIHQATKILASTVQAIEDETIFTIFDEGKTYVRSFIRSYGKALRIPEEMIIKALDQHETGNYNHLLLQSFPELSNVKPADGNTTTPENPVKEKTTEETEEELVAAPAEKAETSAENHNQAEPKEPEPESLLETEKTTDKTTSEPSVRNVDWANVGHKIADEKKRTSAWLAGIIILIILASVAGYFFYQNGYFSELIDSSGQAESTEIQVSQNGFSPDVNAPESEMVEAAQQETVSELNDVLYITVFAAYDKLDPVRIWSDMKPRLDPYWLDEGTAMNFEFQDSIRIRAQYSNILIFKNGHLIENAFEEYFNESENYLELTRNHFNTDSKWATSIPLQTPSGISPPETIIERPTF